MRPSPGRSWQFRSQSRSISIRRSTTTSLDQATWSLNLDARLRPQVANRNGYLGGGINLTHTTETKTNVNLFGGVEGRRGGIRPFAEARLIFGNGTSFQVQGGVNFPLR